MRAQAAVVRNVRAIPWADSDNLIHVFLRGKRYPDYVAVFVCRKTANLGMALTKARMAMPELETAV